jgi:hypothetical protein
LAIVAKTRIVQSWFSGMAGAAVAIVVWQLLAPFVARITLNPRYQAPDFLAVLSQMVARPPDKAHLVRFALFWVVLLGGIHGMVFSRLRPSLPGAATARKGLSFGILLWIFSYLFFEFLHPWGQFHEPMPLVLLELLMWLVVALAEGMTLAALSPHG